MFKKVVFIHTVPVLIEIINRLGSSYLPGVEFCHILNEVLVDKVRKNGKAGSQEKEWLKDQISNAHEIGASAVVVTCTILSGFVDELKPMAKIPIFRIDEEMAKKAVSIGSRIGIIVTNPDSIPPSTDLIQDYADSINKRIVVLPALAEKAFEAVRNGNGDFHDQQVRKKIFEIAPQVDVIVLAQASMARVLDTIPEIERPVPILSSPHLALVKLREILI